MTGRSSLTVVLAAGEGTRMRSSVPKVLNPVAGRSLLAHVLAAAPKGTGALLAVVIGPDQSSVAEEVKRVRPDALTFVQHERLGTAHAVLAARDVIAGGANDLLVVFGDTAGTEPAFCAVGCGSAVVEEVATACAGVMAEFCRTIAPVTEPRPCSRNVTREYSRSRSLFSVSTADARRRVSFSLSLAAVWICCDWRCRSAAASCSRRNPMEDWLA